MILKALKSYKHLGKINCFLKANPKVRIVCELMFNDYLGEEFSWSDISDKMPESSGFYSTALLKILEPFDRLEQCKNYYRHFQYVNKSGLSYTDVRAVITQAIASLIDEYEMRHIHVNINMKNEYVEKASYEGGFILNSVFISIIEERIDDDDIDSEDSIILI